MLCHSAGAVLTFFKCHHSDVIKSPMASQITGISIVYSTVCSGADQRKHQNSASLAFVRGTHRLPRELPTGFPSQRASDAENVPFDDVIMLTSVGTEGFRRNGKRNSAKSSAISSVKLGHDFKRRATETRGRFYASVINRLSKVGLEHMPWDFSMWGCYIIPGCLCLHKKWKLEEMYTILCDNLYYVEPKNNHFYEPQGDVSWLTYEFLAAWIRNHIPTKVWGEITTCKDDLSVPYSMDT